MPVPVVVRPEVRTDIEALPTRELQLEALSFIVRLKAMPRLGQLLENRPETGDLSGCRKLYFDQARHRIVYRLLPDESQPQSVDVIAVGPRADMAAYTTAAQRLV